MSRLGPAVVFLFLVLSLASPAFEQSPSPDPTAATGVWVAGGAGAVKIAATDGSPLSRISGLDEVRAVALDGVHETIWLASEHLLSVHGFDGTQRMAIALPAASANHSSLAADPTDGSVWLAMGRSLTHFSPAGGVLASLASRQPVRALALDAADGLLWLATRGSLSALATASGTVVHSVDLGRDHDLLDIDFDAAVGRLWTCADKTVGAYDRAGNPLFQARVHTARAVAGDRAGGAWVATGKGLVKVSAQGMAGGAFEALDDDDLIEVVTDPGDGSAWVASERSVAQVDAAGVVRHRSEIEHPFAVRDLAAYADIYPPDLAIAAPRQGSLVNSKILALELSWSDIGSGVDASTLTATANGTALALQCSYRRDGATCSSSSPLPEGAVVLAATVRDFAHNSSHSATVSYTIDTIPPQVTVSQPADGALTNQRGLVVAGSLSEPAILTLNGASVTVLASLMFAQSIALQEGTNQLVLAATDRAGNVGQVMRTVTLDTIPPGLVDTTKVTVTVAGGQATVTGAAGSAEAGAALTVTDSRGGQAAQATVATNGSFSAILVAQPGDTLVLVATDAAGNRGAPAAVSVPGQPPPPGPPPDPASVAPRLDASVATDFAAATSFLYAGTSPVQTGVSAGAIEPRRAAVVRGRVLQANGSPLPGVQVTIAGHPEFGSTASRSDGMFDLAANGGGLLVLVYDKGGYAQLHRQVYAPWRDFAHAADAVMTALDSQVTTIASAAATMQVARGSRTQDADGARQATLLFPAGTQAQMVLRDGSTQPLSTLSFRATEYTVGERGPDAMPAPLPPTSVYTYAVELSADEVAAAGAAGVAFSQPVFYYLENFLGMPVGGPVPAGYYDRSLAAWIPAQNGLVLKVLDIQGGLADLDLTGTGAAASAAALANAGITDAERQLLAGLYQPGQSLWRVPVQHFSPWDFNWPVGQRPQPPAEPEPTVDPPPDNPDCIPGSVIECQTQSLGENLRLTGSPIGLRYRSSRTAASRALIIPLSGATLPPLLARIDLHIGIAGQFFELSFPAAPNQAYTFAWDGRDAYGRLLHGSTPVAVTIVYAYRPPYGFPSGSSYSFGRTASGELGGPTARSFYPLFQDRTVLLANRDLRPLGPPGWSLTPHHSFDPASRTLLRGDGASTSLAADLLGRVAGTEKTLGFGGDGGPAAQALLFGPRGLATDSRGNLYIADTGNHRIRKVSPDGLITTFAGNGSRGFSGDGGPGTAAQLASPNNVAVDAADNVLIVDTWNHRIRKVNARGVITTVAGNGANGYNGDAMQATSASLFLPGGVAADAAGNLFIADTFNCMIRKVTADGFLVDVAGFSGYCPSSAYPNTVPFYYPQAIAVDAAGSLYVPDGGTGEMKKILPDGRIAVLFGRTSDGPTVSQSSALMVDPQGTLFITSGGTGGFWRIQPDGTAHQVTPGLAGCPLCLPDDLPFSPVAVQGLAKGPNGDLLFTTGYDVRRLGPALGNYLGGGLSIASGDGSEVYDFDSTGRHLQTRSALTGAPLFTFSYDAAGRLAGISDAAGNLTTIERSGPGDPTAVTTPFGERTGLTVDPFGNLTRITDPAGASTRLTYAGNLLSSLIDPNGGSYLFTYDSAGRLASDQDPAGGGRQLIRSALVGGYNVDVITGLKRKTSYAVTSLPSGGQLRTTVLPTGLQVVRSLDAIGDETTTFPDGTAIAVTVVADPRFGFEAPVVSTQTTMPSGLSSTSIASRSATLANPADPASLAALAESFIVNGRTFTSSFDPTQRVYTLVTPMGRQQSSLIDAQGRPLQLTVGNLTPILFSYDPRGRLTSLTQGSGIDARATTLAYDSLGRVASVTDPMQRTTGFTYDGAERAIRETLPDGQTLGVTFDANGNALSFTPPGRAAHGFAYNAVNLPVSYAPPDLGAGGFATSYSYDLDRELVRVSRPDGEAVTATYDAAGRLATIVDGRGTTTFSYDPASGHVGSIASPEGGQVSYRYDGSLVTRTTWSGEVAGTIDRTYNPDFRLGSLSVNGGAAISYQYDGDGLLIQAGDLALQNDSQNGLLAGTSLGQVATTATYNAFGEVVGASAAAGTGPVVGAQYTRDKLGRITQKVETIGGATNTYRYSYDARGRLTTVGKDGVTLSTYAYDAAGNRLSWTGPTGTRVATYDGQDRLLQYGDLSYSYRASGELAAKTQNGHTMSYTYDALGNLLGVTTADGIAISYVVDGRNRRIGKKVNGTLVTGFLYRDQLGPAAQLDVSGNVVALFVYATRLNVPDYMVAGGRTYRILTDQLGSPRLVVDSQTGAVAQRMDYDEFGQVILDTSPGFQPFGFGGGLYDGQTGLVRFGYRDYDPQTGRWTAKDPLGLAGGEPTLYGYAAGDPVNNGDIFGLFPKDCSWYKPLADWLCEQIQELADELDIDPDFLLALAAKESQWNDHENGSPGDPPQHAVELNNPFGVTQAGGNNLGFASLGDAFAFWNKNFGNKVRGAKNIKDFANDLKRAKYNTRTPKYYERLQEIFKAAQWFSQHCKDKCSEE
jgi:RHS repeat-associated protein